MCWHATSKVAVSDRLAEFLCSGVYASSAVKVAFYIGGGLLVLSIALAVAVAVRPRSTRALFVAGSAALAANAAGMVFAVAGIYGLATATVLAAVPLDLVRFVFLPRAAGDAARMGPAKAATAVGALFLATLFALMV